MPFPHLPSPPALFPTYLVPSLPFRRRTSSTDSTASNLSYTSEESIEDSVSPEPSSLSGHASHLRCGRCAADLALSSQIISKGFTGRHGRAYLVAPSPSAISTSTSAILSGLSTPKARNDALPNLPNTYTHKPVPRQLVTGAHTVGDISCAQCGSVLGWKYVAAEEEAQRYKVGKFILETKRVCRTSMWESEGDPFAPALPRDDALDVLPRVSEREEIEFDSQDEDECEDLFMGIWTPQLAAKRRRQRKFHARAEAEA